MGQSDGPFLQDDNSHKVSGNFTSPGNLQHGILHRLLKLVQRNQTSTPPKEIFNRWNTFCDAHAPPIHQHGKPIRDPKLLDKDFILRFMLEMIPRPFWISLVKKIQADQLRGGRREEWTEYCDLFAPVMANGQTRVRDPRKLETEFLLSFVASALDNDDPKAGVLASIIDSYQFDFHTPPRNADGEERASQRATATGSIKDTLQEDSSVLVLTQVVKILQRASKFVKCRWNDYCDEHAPQLRGIAVRDPIKQSSHFLRGFLCGEVPTSKWTEAVTRSTEVVPSLLDALESYMQITGEASEDPWQNPESLLDFLCSALEQHEEVAGAINEVFSGFE